MRHADERVARQCECFAAAFDRLAGVRRRSRTAPSIKRRVLGPLLWSQLERHAAVLDATFSPVFENDRAWGELAGWNAIFCRTLVLPLSLVEAT